VEEVWTTAHLAALTDPTQILSVLPQSRGFAAQTVRQTVQLTRGSTAIRLVLSNEFGHVPLVIDEVAVSGDDRESVLPALHHAHRRWEIPAGATATSDPIPLPIVAGGDLVVSCYISGPTALNTYLPSAQRTGEVAPGNQLGNRQLIDAEPFTTLYWIAQVLVDAPAKRPVIIALGDSITRGDGTTTDRQQRYPDHLQRRLQAAGLDGAVVLNAGISGNRLLQPGVGPSMTDRFARDVLGVAEATHVIIMGGLNDLAAPFGELGGERPTADELTDGLFALARRAQQHGIQPILGTITPFAGSIYESFRADGNEEIRQAVNHTVMAQRNWPAVDFASAVAEPGDPNRLAPPYDSGDGVHPADAGHHALANAIDPAMFA
jgi:lysophospholipase L1-like esterase